MKKIIQNKKYRNIAKIVFLIVWLGVIFYFSSIPHLLFSLDYPVEIWTRKLAHFFEFGLLVLLLYKVISIKNDKPFRRNLWIAVILTLLYAFSDEFHQTFIEGRHGHLIDVYIDSFGMLTIAWLIIMEREHQERFSKKKHFIKI